MFNFAYPTHLYLLAAVPLLALLFVAARYSAVPSCAGSAGSTWSTK